MGMRVADAPGMRTSELDPSASGEIELSAPVNKLRIVEKKVIVNKRLLLPIPRPRREWSAPDSLRRAGTTTLK
jgi:hypothetical protein